MPTLEIRTDAHKKEGLYLYFANGDSLSFLAEDIRQLADEWWNNPSKIPSHIKEKEDFKTCSICPYKGQNVFCSAVKPLLPVLEKVEKFLSHDKVTAVYVKREGVLQVSDTTMQNALQYIVNMSFFEYCEETKKYHEYFRSVTPFMTTNEAICHIFLSIYWLNKGDEAKTKKIIDQLNLDITNTTKSCVNRLRLICKSDAFMNAYVKTQASAEMLALNIEPTLEKYFEGKI